MVARPEARYHSRMSGSAKAFATASRRRNAWSWRRAPPLLLLWLVYALFVLSIYHVLTRFRAHYLFILILFAGAALAQGVGMWKNLSRRGRVSRYRDGVASGGTAQQ